MLQSSPAPHSGYNSEASASEGGVMRVPMRHEIRANRSVRGHDGDLTAVQEQHIQFGQFAQNTAWLRSCHDNASPAVMTLQ